MCASARYVDFGISDSSDFFCGLLENGNTECRTINVRELSDISSDPDTLFTDIEVGALYACGITSVGSVSCWGTAADEVLNAPSFDAEVVKIKTYSYGACAVDAASNAKCWGELPASVIESDNLISIVN